MFCSNCGKELQENEIFCSACGKKVSNNSETGSDKQEKRVLPYSKYLRVGVVAVVLLIVVLFVSMSIKYARIQNGSDAPINPDEEISYSRVQCMACDGTGKIKCSSCLGSGTYIAGWDDNFNSIKKPCRAGCGGTGKVNCEYCNGTGWR